MKKLRIAAGTASALGLAIILYGSLPLQKHRSTAAETAADAKPRIGASPGAELAAWLLSEGRTRLRAGRIDAAADAAAIAAILDPESGADALASEVAKRRARLLGNFDSEVKDAHAAGDLQRMERVQAISSRMKVEEAKQ